VAVRFRLAFPAPTAEAGVVAAVADEAAVDLPVVAVDLAAGVVEAVAVAAVVAADGVRAAQMAPVSLAIAPGNSRVSTGMHI
jgi:hypothetical protein